MITVEGEFFTPETTESTETKMSPLQKLTMEHTKHAERVKFVSKRIIFCHSAHLEKIFITLF